MTEKSDTSLTFFLGESGDVEWIYEVGIPDINTEQAMVIVQARGMSKLAAAFDRLAFAVETLGEKLNSQDS